MGFKPIANNSTNFPDAYEPCSLCAGLGLHPLAGHYTLLLCPTALSRRTLLCLSPRCFTLAAHAMNNNRTLLIASFLTLIAAGVGFAIRGGGMMGEWANAFGFDKTDLGKISGLGLTGFGLTIIVCSLIVDRVGYKPLLLLAFGLHVASAVITLAATPIYQAMGKDATRTCLGLGMFMFALANGVCESVINPLVATLYSKQKTHYLNILHAGWPAGLIVGGLMAFTFVGNAAPMHLRWEIPIALFLLPTLAYGFMVIKEKFPDSEAKAAGLTFGKMASVFASPVLWVLLLLHAMIGYVELGTDSWITDIMNNVIQGKAVLLFVYTSSIMFILRFFAGPIVERINPVGLLLASSLLGCAGLYWLSGASGIWMVVLAATVYGVGKTFLWPTILGVVGERFPQGGALVMGAMGGIGMITAGEIASPVIGYQQDFYASQELEKTSKPIYDEYKAPEPNHVLFFPEVTGLDGKKAEAIKEKRAKGEDITTAEQQVFDAGLYGGRMALQKTALVPLIMAIGFLLLVIYFRLTGGYQAEELKSHRPEGEEFTGGVEGPVA